MWTSGYGEEGTLGHGEASQEACIEFKKIEFFEQHNITISQISCGYAHTIALTDDDRIFVWGGNTNGQLGLGDTNTRFEPTLSPFFQNRRVKGLACGYLHSLVWSEYNIL